MKKKILVFSPHTDDGELGCGGTIVKYLEKKNPIYYTVFSMAEKSVPKGFPKDILAKELKRAMDVLGVSSNKITKFNYDVREFPKFRQEILEDMVKIGDLIRPDVVLTPSSKDIHQDHRVIYEETLRAFKKTTILGYEEPWNNITFDTRAINPLEKRHIKKKIDALMCYKTQKKRAYLNEEYIWGLARTRGTQIEKDYAEAFEVIRWVLD